jgi:hypothetical protein
LERQRIELRLTPLLSLDRLLQNCITCLKVNRFSAKFWLPENGEKKVCLNFNQHLLRYVREQYKVSEGVVVVRTVQ